MENGATRQVLPLPAAWFHILLSLWEGPKHGYGVKHELEARTGGVIRLGPSTLYETIYRLEQKGFIAETGSPPAGTSNPRQRFYELTPHGREVLEAEIHRLEDDVQQARAIVSPEPEARSKR